jgi:hypothetical protein
VDKIRLAGDLSLQIKPIETASVDSVSAKEIRKDAVKKQRVHTEAQSPTRSPQSYE